MRIEIQRHRQPRRDGFTLAETVIASAIVALMVMANLAAVYNMRILSEKDSERGIVSGFIQHYMELVKALPFDQVMPNQPISGLYPGASGTPRITLPASSDWVNITQVSFQAFHPALIWITNRHPQMKVLIEIANVAGAAHDKHISMEVQWDAPLQVGPRLSQRLDLFRVKDL